MLTFLLILLFPGKCANGCKFSTNRGTFDLSPLAEKSFTVQSAGTFYFSICSNTADVSHCGGLSNVCAVQYLQGISTCFDIATWDKSYKLTGSSDGFSLEFDNGSKDLCTPAKPRSIKYIFTCSEGTPYGTMTATEPSGCIYQVTIPTMYVCDDYAIHVSDELSPGSILLIVLLVLISVYCIVGFGFNIYNGSARGLQAVPQASF
jgi:hypothetical protein